MGLLDVLPVMFPSEDNDTMCRVPIVKEIEQVVMMMDPGSSPGPDGFSGAFFHTCWPIIKHDIAFAIQSFFSDPRIPYGLNLNFITLIPKIANPLKPSHFQPICMVNFFMKIISKILQERIKKNLPGVISKEQTGFIAGRNIQSNI